MVVDTSALVAILLAETEARQFSEAAAAAGKRMMSAVTQVELSLVIEGRKGEPGREAVDRLLGESDIEVVAVTPQMALGAIDAFRRFGRGRHKAALNIGDCFSYALAIALDEPLLFKGEDFARTDARSAAP